MMHHVSMFGRVISTYILHQCKINKFLRILIFASAVLTYTDGQVISHELRRLAVSTNQFGIDALKALDRVEPPDRVLVFCPVCLSSSLIMIMMGSSKYHVVSSLRHALYVWSLRPREINQGFSDIFDHIDLNQKTTKFHNIGAPSLTDTRARRASPLTSINNQVSNNSEFNEHYNYLKYDYGLPISLPELIKARELIERSAKLDLARKWGALGRRFHPAESEPDAGNNQDLKKLRRNGTLSLDLNKTSQMSATSNIYLQRGFTTNYNYNLLLRKFYKTIIHPVDFVRNAEETRQHINSLVASSTEGKIKDLLRKGFSNKTAPKIVMLSTFHFRGTLDIEMKNISSASHRVERSSNIDKQPGTTTYSSEKQTKSKNSLFIETEPTLLKYGHFSHLDCIAVEVPFSSHLVTLVIVMPNDRNSTEVLLTKLSAQVLSDLVSSLIVRRVSLSIPVIKFDRGPIDVENLLKELGLENLFFGDKPYSSETGLNRWLRPSDIMHETSIDIGTLNPNIGQVEDRLTTGAHKIRASEENRIRLDKPFFYFVVDSINGLILTMGRIRH